MADITTSVNQTNRKTAGTPTFEKLVLTTVIGDQIDITSQLIHMDIFEDIYSPVITGNITIFDNNGFFQKIPICGQEQLTVRFYSWNYDPNGNLKVNYFHRTFDTLKIINVKQVNDFSMEYTLQFASPELKKNETIKISKAYQNVTPSAIVAAVMTEDYNGNPPTGLSFPKSQLDQPIVRSPYLDNSTQIEANYQKVDANDSIELFVEKTKFIEPWITIPYMKPFDIIEWLASRSLRLSVGRNKTQVQSEAANFLFFENKRGFQFTSIDTLLENKVNNNSVLRMGYGAENQEIDQDRDVLVDTIEKLQIMDCYDTLGNIRSGLFSSMLQTYDFTTGQINEVDYDYLESFITTESTEDGNYGPTIPISEWPGVNDYPFIKIEKDGTNPITKKFLAKRMLVGFNPGRLQNNITSEETQKDGSARTLIGPEAYVQKRISQLARWTNFRIAVQISGNSVHTVGNVITVDLHDAEYNNGFFNQFTEVPSKYYSGKYLITSIRHSLTKYSYEMYMELAKDSYKSAIMK